MQCDSEGELGTSPCTVEEPNAAEMSCPAEFGCEIWVEGERVVRGCSQERDSACDAGIDEDGVDFK